MTLGDILDGAFKLMKANLRTVALVTALFVVPLNLLGAFFQRSSLSTGIFDILNDPSLAETTQSDPGVGDFVGYAVTLLASLIVTPFVAGAIARVVGSSYLGEQLTPGPALRATGRRFWALLWSWVLTHLLEGSGLLLTALLVGVLAAVNVDGRLIALVGVPLGLAGLLLPLALMALFVAVAPAIVVEELGPVRGIRRSWRLLRSRFWPVLGISILAGLIAYVLGSILGTPFTLLAAVVGGSAGWPLLALGSILPEMITTPFIAIVATLIYFDGRIRSEGFDLQVVAADLARTGVAR
jgi:hypothetical protein